MGIRVPSSEDREIACLEVVCGLLQFYTFSSRRFCIHQKLGGAILMLRIWVDCLVGSLLIIKASRYIEKRREMLLIFGSAMLSSSTFLFGIGIGPIFCLVFSAFYGFFEQFVNIPYQALLQTYVDRKKIAKVFGVTDMINAVMFGLSTIIMGVVSYIYGVQVSFYLATFSLALSSVGYMFSSRKLNTRKLEM